MVIWTTLFEVSEQQTDFEAVWRHEVVSVCTAIPACATSTGQQSSGSLDWFCLMPLTKLQIRSPHHAQSLCYHHNDRFFLSRSECVYYNGLPRALE
jgi:hypothetical protein